jgi:tRNA pseudouridine38-40 synthase
MPRTIRLLLAYDGTSFRGWAAQGDPTIRTVEGVLTEVLAPVLGRAPRLSVAGRTDAGVHARGQVASFVTPSQVPALGIRDALNGRLSPEVVCCAADVVPAGFDARFSATAREYRYRIDLAPVPDPFTGRFVWHRPGELDLGAMRAAARHLVGRHDFTSFCRRSPSGHTAVRDLQRLSIAKTDARVELGFRANAFLHQMVRAITGSLVLVGSGKLTPEDVAHLLAQKNRKGTGNLAPAHGLTLERVAYGRRARP